MILQTKWFRYAFCIKTGDIMVRLLVALAVVCSFQIQAEVVYEDPNTLSTSSPTVTESEQLKSATEVGLTVSSINSGATFANLNLLRYFGESWAVGLRGLLPLDFDRENQVYQGQIFFRFDLVKKDHVIFMEGNISQGIYTYQGSNELFASMGAIYGYRYNISKELIVGANLGVDYASSHISRDRFTSSNSLYSHMTVLGGFNF